MVIALVLPPSTSDAPDRTQILITGVPVAGRVAVLPDARSMARRNRRLYSALPQRVITAPAVVGSVSGDLADFIFHLRQQVGQQLRVLEIVGRDHDGDTLMGCFVHREVEFAPRPALRVAMLAHFPFAFAVNFEAGRVHHQMQRLTTMAMTRQLDLHRPAPTAQSSVIGHAQRQAKQLDDRREQTLGGAQRQVIDLCQRRHTEDRRLGIDTRCAALTRALGLPPLRDHALTQPQRQASTPDQGFVILTPVAETVLSLGFLLGHTSRLPALPSP